MIDQAIVFGRHQNLVGTVTAPENRFTGDHADVAAIFLTPGMLHHAGPFRLHVALARDLASDGICSLRFDLSGIGESLGVGTAGRSIDRAANEAQQAMDHMSDELGIDKFVLFGLCSGADDSVHAALNDDRIVGVVAMDGCGYRTSRYHWNRLTKHYLPRVISPAKWVSWLLRQSTPDSAPKTLQMGADIREFPPLAQATSEFRQLVDRGVRFHFAYTGGITEYYNYEQQFFDMFSDVDWRGQATTSYFSQMDHVGMLCEDRERLVADINDAIRRIVAIQGGRLEEQVLVSNEH